MFDDLKRRVKKKIFMGLLVLVIGGGTGTWLGVDIPPWLREYVLSRLSSSERDEGNANDGRGDRSARPERDARPSERTSRSDWDARTERDVRDGRVAEGSVPAVANTVPAAVARGDAWFGRCMAVLDGDVMTVTRNNAQLRIRLYGIDCPESNQPYGDTALSYTTSWALNRDVWVSVVAIGRDGTALAAVYVGNVCINRELVANGMAWVFGQGCQVANCTEWQSLQDRARSGRVGLWGTANPTPPWEWPRR